MELRASARIVIRFGPFELDPTTHELREGGVVRKLPPQPFRVLRLLVEHAGHIVTRDDIQHCLWGDRKYVEFDKGINFCLNQIRSALRDPAEKSVYIKTLSRQGYRFVAATHVDAAHTGGANRRETSQDPPRPQETERNALAVDAAINGDTPQLRRAALVPAASWSWPRQVRRLRAAGLLVLLSVLCGDLAMHRDLPALTAKNSVVIGDFVNTTGDEVFNDTLKQALTIALRQSPFFDVLPESRAQKTLQLMGQANDTRITPDVSRKLCMRTGSAATLEGTIASLGSHYVVTINAIACGSGIALVSEQEEAVRKEDVLQALSKSASRLRAALGESLPSLQRFDVPVEATTTSLEALRSYTLGHKVAVSQGDAPSIAIFQRAIELDPQFLLGYVALAARYSNLGQPTAALAYATKAYALRNRGTEIERLLAMTLYLRLTGALEELTKTLNMWKAEYPRDSAPYGSLGVNYVYMGEYQKALAEWREALRISPDNVSMYENLGPIYLALQRPQDARAISEAAWAHKLDGSGLRLTLYHIGFLQNDVALMEEQLRWAVGKPGSEDVLLSAQSDTDAYFGRLGSARNLSRRAIDSAYNADLKETAALWQVISALREAEYGERLEARTQIARALATSSGRNVKVFAALALARVGDTADATAIADELQRDEPHDTALARFRLPSIRAAIALSDGYPERALDWLEVARPYELGRPTPSGQAMLYPVFLRGLAYISLRRGREAAGEFQRIIDNPGIALNLPLGALARLGVARASVLAEDRDSARRAYREFLSIWKQADPNTPILLAAKAEYANLR